jgi:Protein of unknown function (DUF1592)/Protein of unknown function (DUF1588)/Protein of unknown function (DUF1595)/Protein of unknown function (DUF1585)/Protein of unknown function (DUF1587)
MSSAASYSAGAAVLLGLACGLWGCEPEAPTWADPFSAGLAGSSGANTGGDGGPGTEGAGTTSGGDGGTALSCNGPSVPQVSLQRLTQQQYVNSVRDLLSLANVASLGLDLPSDDRPGAFRSNTITPLSDLNAQQYMAAATQLATLALANLPGPLPCAATQVDAACIAQFTGAFGKRAYRRPLSQAEQTAYASLVSTTNASGDFTTSAKLVVEAMLQSPNFLYRVELPAPGAQAGTPALLSSYELATRLSYFLWDSTPDDALLAAADADQLSTQAGLLVQAQRLLQDPRLKDATSSFFAQWLDLDTVATLAKDPTLYPTFNAALGTAMANEALDFGYFVMTQGDGKLPTLLAAPYSILTQPLFSLYGVTPPAGYSAANAATTPVPLDPTQRAGIITMPGFLAVHAHPNETSPVLRGKVIRENFLCQQMPDPPPNVNTTPPTPTPGETTRQLFAQHESDPVCASCHKLMDPIGLGLENYDAIGSYRTTDQGQTIDATGTIEAGGDITGDFDGPIDLARKLSTSETVAQCVALQWLRFALGRTEAPEDACSIQDVDTKFDASSHDLGALLTSIVQSDAFRYRSN